jgi:3-isopropylmalate/(R)-2-methylmalate dehydratase small subunit
MEPFRSVTGIAAPLLEDDINTDQITPVHRDMHPDYAKLLFQRRRFRADGSEEPGFVLNRPQYRKSAILVAGRNFGCGSSREGAVWAMVAVGMRCIIARSFADIYRENCLRNGVLPLVLGASEADAFEAKVLAVDGAKPFTVDLEAQKISCPDGAAIAFDIAASDRMVLLEGLDEIGFSLKHLGEIESWEARMAKAQGWRQTLERNA